MIVIWPRTTHVYTHKHTHTPTQNTDTNPCLPLGLPRGVLFLLYVLLKVLGGKTEMPYQSRDSFAGPASTNWYPSALGSFHPSPTWCAGRMLQRARAALPWLKNLGLTTCVSWKVNCQRGSAGVRDSSESIWNLFISGFSNVSCCSCSPSEAYL